MNICVAGWYFHRPLLDQVAASGFPAFVVKHRDGDTGNLPSAVIDNRGLEFGCYHHYLVNVWDGVSDVLFLQDDGEIHGGALIDIAALADNAEIDQAFVFRDEYEEFMNAGHSGRAFWCRAPLLAVLKKAGGFDVDLNNKGDTDSRHSNYGIFKFAERLHTNPRATWIAIVPGLQMGRRGWISTAVYQYRRNGHSGLMTPPGLE